MARILLIDDEAAVRSGVGRFLKMHGHHVLEAGDGIEALQIAATADLDLVITDINMPEMDGIEVILALSASGKSVPVIAISGGGRMPKDVLLGSAEVLGAVTTLGKPFELSELLAAVDDALAGVGGDG